MLRAFGHPVAMCCDMLEILGVVGSNLKMVKFFAQHLRMCRSARLCINVAPGHTPLFDFQYPTCRKTSQPGGQMLRYVESKCYHRLAGACKYWANNVAICCIEMLQPFGWGLTFPQWLALCQVGRIRGGQNETIFRL